MRKAIIDPGKCQPKKCNGECKRSCPVQRTGKECVEIPEAKTVAQIYESACIGCNICVKACPFGAIRIINLPSKLSQPVLHSYGPNSFELLGIPKAKRGEIIGILGANGMGKTTAVQLLSGSLLPNLGMRDSSPDAVTAERQRRFRGKDVQPLMERAGQLRIANKPQDVERAADPNLVLGEALSGEALQIWGMEHLKARKFGELSGGELQRAVCALACSQQSADVYIFDEPSSFLDVRQRIDVGKRISASVGETSYGIIIEHDLALLDMVSDKIVIHYGERAAYAIISNVYGTGIGINHYIDGKLPAENARIRDEPLRFSRKIELEDEADEHEFGKNEAYEAFGVSFNSAAASSSSHPAGGSFVLEAAAGGFRRGEIVVLLGENGTGKTTMIRHIATLMDKRVSVKPQKLDFPAQYRDRTVGEMMNAAVGAAKMCNAEYRQEVLGPMGLLELLENTVGALSGGERQRVAIAICIGKDREIYLIDEPSAGLDCEQRLIVSKLIKRLAMNDKKTIFVVEHDLMMATYLADKVILFQGQPGVSTTASCPLTVEEGVNGFLKELDITMRIETIRGRMRINRWGSSRDRDQKREGAYIKRANEVQ
jgi:ATP-binding cassette subfamily E protein 1